MVEMQKRVNIRKDAPAKDSPYSPAIVWGSLVFVSGQVPLNPQTGTIVSGDFEKQAEQAFQNLKTILEEAGSSLDKVLKTTSFLTNMDDLGKLNEVYKRHFPKDRPARSCVEVSRLPRGAKVEIEAIAII
jgi:2-iminobutanoate/2-iminopropanoate deaminase